MIDLSARFPELAGRRAVPIGVGWDFDTFDVDGRWIVRIPRRPEVARWLDVEIRLLRELAPLVPAPVPRFELLAREGTGVAYRKLPGRPIARGTRASARELGAFLSALHAFPRERALALGVEEQGRNANRVLVEERWTGFEISVFPVLEPRERALAARRAELFLGDDRNFSVEPVLVHRDLGRDHVLSDYGDRITGIIDWTDACVGDPARDFAWLLHGLGAPFGAALLEAYGGTLDPTLRERAEFYAFLSPFYEIVYGLDNNRSDLLEAGLCRLRERL